MYLILCLLFLASTANAVSMWDMWLGGFGSMSGGISIDIPSNAMEDAYLNINQLAEKYGYPLETHTVITADGYILNMHRMPHGRNGASNGKVVFLMHGLWECSDSWMLQGPGKALAYILADEGYDVWMGNARGNKHTPFHEKFNASSAQFWEFSWEEIGYYDLPAMIDYALAITEEKTMYYVGFSQGTTSYFVMTSMRPEYNKKIKLMFALAPEVFLGNARNILLKIFSPAQSFLQVLLWNFNIYSPSLSFLNKITPFICSVFPLQCDNLFFTAIGPHNIKDELWPVILGHIPTGSSTLQFIHYGQLANSGRFCRFDYGREKNLIKYGQEVPPDYNLKNVKSPVVLFHSGNDWFSDRRDVELLKSYLPKVVGVYFIKQFSHLDFMYADEASTLIYSNIVTQIKNRK